MSIDQHAGDGNNIKQTHAHTHTRPHFEENILQKKKGSTPHFRCEIAEAHYRQTEQGAAEKGTLLMCALLSCG